MAATVLKFDLHLEQRMFLKRLDETRGLYPGEHPAGRTVPFKTSTPALTTPSTPEPAEEPQRYVPPANDMSFLHVMNSLECMDCGHDWIQPADKGRCTQCKSENTRVFLSRRSELKRV